MAGLRKGLLEEEAPRLLACPPSQGRVLTRAGPHPGKGEGGGDRVLTGSCPRGGVSSPGCVLTGAGPHGGRDLEGACPPPGRVLARAGVGPHPGVSLPG